MPTWNVYYNQWLTLRVTATNDTKNITNNTSRVRTVVQLVSSSDTRVWSSDSQRLVVRVDGQTLADTTFTYDISNRGTLTLGTFDKIVSHNADGSKETNVFVEARYDGARRTVNQSYTLMTIERASVPTLTKGSVLVGEATEIHFNRATHTFTHTVKFIFGSKTVSIANKTTEGMVTYTPTEDLLTEIPKDRSGWGVIQVETFNGTTKLGESSIRLTIQVPDTDAYRPTANKPTLAEGNSKVTSAVQTGIWVQGHSIVKITATFALKHGSTLANAFIKVGGTEHRASVSGNTATVNIPLDASVTGSRDVSLRVVDSRGLQKVSAVQSFTITPYERPRLQMTAYRHKDDSDRIMIVGSATGVHLSNRNTMTMKAYIRASGTTSWGSAIMTSTSSNGSIAWTESSWNDFTGTHSEFTSWEVRVTLADELMSGTDEAVFIERIGTIKFPFSAYKDEGVAIGKLYELPIGGVLQVAGLVTIDGSIMLTGKDQDIRLSIDPVEGNASMELGATKIPSTPYIDFHSSGNNNDRDARIISNGGGTSSELGALSYNAGSHHFSGDLFNGGAKVLDYGNNTYGHYLKFSNGVMICWGREERTVPTSLTNGNVYRSNSVGFDFPATFVPSPVPVINISTYDAWAVLMTKMPTTGFATMLFKGTSAPNLATAISWTAIGRWKN